MIADLRFALRQFTKTPGFAAIAVLTLALGIGANTALFSIINGVLLRPLLFPEPDRLVSLAERSEQGVHPAVNLDNLLEWRERQQSFESIGAACPWTADLAGSTGAEQLTGAQVTSDYLAAAGVAPLRGRLFQTADEAAAADRTVVISEALWRRLFAGRDDALGAKITIKGTPYTVVGILPRGFIHPTPDCAFWVPVAPFAWDYRNHVPRTPGPFLALARLKPGVGLDAARRDLETVARQLALAQPATNRGRSVVLESLTERLFRPVRPTLWLLLGATAAVLVIACANLAGLQMARTQSRLRDHAIRQALGASRLRNARLLLTENLLLALLGCGGGLLLAAWVIDGIRLLLPAGFPRLDEITLDTRVLTYALAASLAATLFSGLVPLWQVLRSDLTQALAAGGRTAGTAADARWHAALIVTEVALSCVLLVGTGLMLQTLHRLYRTDLGFTPAELVSFSWSPSLPEGPRAQILQRALDRLAGLPGVKNVSLISEMPLGGRYFTRPLSVEGAPAPAPGEEAEGASFSVSLGYFSTMQMPVLQGRAFTARDHEAKAPLVTIIDTRLAERHFPGKDPIGRRIKFGTPGDRRPWLEVVGVVAHVENRGPGQTSGAQSYIPWEQRGPPPTMAFMVRTAGDAAGLEPQVRKVMRELSPDLPIYSVATMSNRLGSVVSAQRLSGLLLSAFAGLALLLAIIGLYGVLSYRVSQRTREIGIRMALGAQRPAVLGLIIAQGLRLTALGLVLGLAAAAATTRVFAGLLYQTAPTDPVSFLAAAVVLAGAALAACWLPARRATRVDPIDALRSE